MQLANNNIVWLASWYPSRIKPFDGDFIQRHAKACSLFKRISVIHVVRDEKGVITKDFLIEKNEIGQLTEIIIYYYSPRNSIRFIEKLRSEIKYRALFKKAIQDFIENKGKPSLIHVHTGMKAGIIARWICKTKSIPYLVTEHWTGFLSESSSGFSNLPWYYRRMWRKIAQEARMLTVVSEYLKKNIRTQLLNKDMVVIPNVVDTDIFSQRNQLSSGVVFVHISNLQLYKNPSQIIQAYSRIVKHYPDSRLEIIGGFDEKLVLLVNEKGIKDNVVFYPEIDQLQLAEHIHNATALILYSHYETFGCVIIEANACGIPVIVSDIPVFHETVTNNFNGIFAKPSDPEHLATIMLQIIKKRSDFDSNSIAKMTAEKYSYEVVGKQFAELYDKLLNS